MELVEVIEQVKNGFYLSKPEIMKAVEDLQKLELELIKRLGSENE